MTTERIEALHKAYGREARRGLVITVAKAPEGIELYRISWNEHVLSHRGNTEERRIVMWRGYAGSEMMTSHRRASVLDYLNHYLANYANEEKRWAC